MRKDIFSTGTASGLVLQKGDQVFLTEAWKGLLPGMMGTIREQCVGHRNTTFGVKFAGKRSPVAVPKRLLTKKWYGL